MGKWLQCQDLIIFFFSSLSHTIYDDFCCFWRSNAKRKDSIEKFKQQNNIKLKFKWIYSLKRNQWYILFFSIEKIPQRNSTTNEEREKKRQIVIGKIIHVWLNRLSMVCFRFNVCITSFLRRIHQIFSRWNYLKIVHFISFKIASIFDFNKTGYRFSGSSFFISSEIKGRERKMERKRREIERKKKCRHDERQAIVCFVIEQPTENGHRILMRRTSSQLNWNQTERERERKRREKIK